MDGPEQLEVGPPAPPRHRRWVVLGAVVLVLTGLGVFRAVGPGSAPGPAPSPSLPAPTELPSTPQPWPVDADLPAGTLYVLSNAGLFTVDASTGLVTKTRAEVSAEDTRLTPMAGGVLVWSDGARPTPHLLAYGSPEARSVGGGFRGVNTFLPGADRQVWAAEIDRRGPAPRNAWRLVDDQGRVSARTEVRGFAVTDGAGGLFGVDGATLRHVWPGPSQRWRADLLATGRDGYEVVRCVQQRCSGELHDRASGAVTPAGAFSVYVDPGALSPGNRFVATVARGPGDSTETRVVVPGSAAVLRSFPTGGYATASAWMSDRWLVATSEEGLVLYDAVDDVLIHPVLPIDAMSQLVWQPS